MPEPPFEALDEALGRDERAQEARMGVKQALADLTGAEGTEDHRRASYAAEEAINALVAAALDVGWEVGWTAASARR